MRPFSPFGPLDPDPDGRAGRPSGRWWHPAVLVALLLVGVLALVLVRSATTPPPLAEESTAPTVVAPRHTGQGPVDPPSSTAGRPTPSGSAGPGDGYFVEATGGSAVAGTDGPVRRYRVVVEADSGQDPAAFAAVVDATLADPRSWTASGELRVQRVSGPEPADFTVYLATAATSERMCAEGGLVTAGYASCRLPGQVIINLDRWLTAVPDYAAPLEVYQAYVINHEVGHEFGELHEACPGPGRPAPVMQQQTYGLAGCLANAWPYLDGHRYAGDLVP